MRPNHTMNRRRAQAIEIRRADGKVIGEVRPDATFQKYIDASKMFLRRPEAIAFDLDTLAQAKEAGARFVEIHDRESGRIFRTTIDRIWKRGFSVNRGHGEQIALALNEWNRDDDAPAPTTPKPTQPALFNLAHLLRQ